MTFAAMGALATSIYAGARLAQFGIRRLIAGGFGVATIGAAIVCLYGFWGWTPILLSGLFIKGMGLGAVMAVASIAMISGVPSHRAGMASSVEEVSYEFGSLTSIAVLGSLVTALYSALVVLPAGAPESAGRACTLPCTSRTPPKLAGLNLCSPLRVRPTHMPSPWFPGWSWSCWRRVPSTRLGSCGALS